MPLDIPPTTAPLTNRTWADFERLMGPKGGCGGCWCMLWRSAKAEFDANTGPGNRAAIKKLAAADPPPGLLAYIDDQPVGWVSVAPRSGFPRLEASRVLKPVDDMPVWSVSCFLIHKTHRRQGVALALLEAACGFAGEHGAAILEGYPIAPKKAPYPPVYAWTGFEAVFKRAGFKEVARRSPTRPILRKAL